MNTTVLASAEKDSLSVSVISVNKGDEPAMNVQAEIQAAGTKQLLAKTAQLGVDATYQQTAKIKLHLIKPGQYPLVVTMHYADANLYPFSALNCQSFSYKAASGVDDIFGQVKSDTFWKEGKLTFTLKNLSNKPISALVSVVTPRELSPEKEIQGATVGAKAEAILDFPIKNFSALSGSSYQVFCQTEYESEDGTHQTVFTPGIIGIEEAKTILGFDYKVVSGILVLLALIFVIAQFIKKD